MTLSELLKSTRQYFWNLDFEEVEIPYLNDSLPLEPNLYAFETTWTHTSKKFYLPLSPEFALKKHLADHKHNCFAITHCFRDLESSGPHHRPEFLMLEYYLIGKNLDELKTSLHQYISKFINIEFTEITLPSHLPDNEPDFNQFFLNEIEPTIPTDKAVFITGYPAFLSPLASNNEVDADVFLRNFNTQVLTGAKKPSANLQPIPLTSRAGESTNHAYPHKSLRFELYLNGIEIANGCEENRNSEQILQSFKSEDQYRCQHHLPTHPYSTDFAQISSHLPHLSGVGIGLERLLMVINHEKSL